MLNLLWVLPSFAGIIREKNISYVNPATHHKNLLDVYHDKNTTSSKDVIVFIHGGAWNSGKKDTYFWLGKNFVRKNAVAVIINYGLAPDNQYEQMAGDCAAAVKWVKNNIKKYGGNPERIFVMGHSAGGHLASLIDLDPRFFAKQGIKNPIKGVILNDAFGLDMFEYLTKTEQDHYYRSFVKTFSPDQEVWKKASPLTYVSNIKNPYLIFAGGRTYPAIQIQSKRLADTLTATKHHVKYYKVGKKKHIGMITQMILGSNRLYRQIFEFMAGVH
ncbi:MAG TPA: alpha/beta hydrolase [Sphingobacteriaceae bacterium]|nr:alpha/beta hydrolase [Sphingobacteriaceae bacterium]